MKAVSRLLKSLSKSGKKGVAWLVDPDKTFRPEQFSSILGSGLDLILVGGSSPSSVHFEKTIQALKAIAGSIPVCIFPGSCVQLSDKADAILFMSLISGRNPDFLISHQVQAAPEIARIGLEVLPTGYLLVNEGELLSVHRASQTLPIANQELETVRATALAGRFLGMKFFYLDAGSGAGVPVSPLAIATVKKAVRTPLIVGGGLDKVDKVRAAFEAGADLVVVGNAIEKDPGFLAEVLEVKRSYNLIEY